MGTAVVQSHWPTGVRYVDWDGYRYESDDLPPEGIEVTVETFTGYDDNPGADVSWSAASPSGRGFTRIHGACRTD